MKTKYTLAFALLLLSFCRLSAITISSANGGGEWNTPGVWSPAQVPTASDSVVITVGNPINTISSTYASAKSLNILAGASLSKSSTFNIYRVLNVDGSFSGIGNIYFNGSNIVVSGAAVISCDGHFDFTGTATINAGTVINKPANINLNPGTTLTNKGSITLVSGHITLPAGATFINAAGSSFNTYNNWVVGGTLNCSANPNTATFQSGTTSIPAANPSYFHLTLTGSGTKALSSNTQVSGNFTINGGAYNGNGFNMTLAGNWANNVGVYNTNSPNNNVIFNGSATQTVFKSSITEDFDNITLSGTGTVLLNSPITANGNVTINSGTLDVNATNKAVTVRGSWNNTGGTFNPRNGTVTFLPSSPKTLTKSVGSETFYNFTLNSSSTLSLMSNINCSKNVNISGATLNAGSATIALSGDWNHTAGTFTAGTSTVNFQGASGTQVMFSTPGTETFNNLTKTAASVLLLANPIICNGNFSITAGTFDVHPNNFMVTLKGNGTFNATLLSRSGTFTLNGGAAQSISASVATTFFNLTLNNAAGATFTAGTFNITNILTSSAGTLTNGGGTVTLVSNSAKIAVIGSGAGSFAGNYILQRYIPARTANWHDLSSPVASTTLADWNQSAAHEIYMSGIGGPDGTACCPTFYSVHIHDETAASSALYWTNITTNAQVLGVGQGFQVFLGDNLSNWTANSLPDTRGTPNSGTVNVPLSFTPAAYDPGANLIGNPFHSHVTWNLNTMTNIDPTIYLLDNNGNYGSYSGAVDIPPLQGFIAYATAGGASVGFVQAAKTVSTGTTFNRTGQAFYTLSLKLTSPMTEYSHEIFVNFNNQTSTSYDPGEDAYFIKSPEKRAPNLSMIMNGISRPLIRNAFNPNLTEDIMAIPIKARVGISGTYTIEANGIKNITDYSCVLLQDLFTKKMIDLSKQPAYSFNINEGDNPDRFVLYLVRKSNDCDDLIAKSKPDFFNANQVLILNTDQGAYVHFDLDAITPATIGIYDMLGNQVSQKSLEAFSGNEKLELPFASGLYLVRVTVGDHVITGKVFAGPQR